MVRIVVATTLDRLSCKCRVSCGRGVGFMSQFVTPAHVRAAHSPAFLRFVWEIGRIDSVPMNLIDDSTELNGYG